MDGVLVEDPEGRTGAGKLRLGEDVIARAIAEQASLSDATRHAAIPAVVVGVGAASLGALRRLAEDAGPRLRLVHLGFERITVPEGITALAIPPDWNQDFLRSRHIEEWLSPELARIKPEAGEVRQIDRLAFFSHFEAIKGVLQAARDEALESGGGPISFSIVASLGEGAGSGLIFDLAFLARQIANTVPGAGVVGYLALDESGGGPFAALQELDFLQSGGELPVRYSTGAPAQVMAAPLFSACYLLEAGTGGLFDLMKHVAGHIHADLIPGGFGWANRAIRDRHDRVARSGKEDGAGCSVAYRSFGVAALRHSEQGHARNLGLRLAAGLLGSWVDDAAPESGNRLAHFCRDTWSAGDQSAGILKQLAISDDRSLKDGMREAIQTLKTDFEAARHVSRYIRAWLSDRLGAILDQSPAEAISAAIPTLLPPFEIALTEELGNFAGISDQRAFLIVLLERFDRYIGLYAANREKEAEIVTGLRAQIEDRLDEIQKVWINPLAFFAGGRKVASEAALSTFWRLADDLQVARLRLALFEAAPSALTELRAAAGRRLGSIEAARSTVLKIRKAFLDQANGDRKASQGLLHEPSWLERDLEALEGGDRATCFAGLTRALLGQDGADLVAFVTGQDDSALTVAMLSATTRLVEGLPACTLADRFLDRNPEEAMQRSALEQLLLAATPALDGSTAAREESLLIGIPGGPANPHGAFANLLDLLLLCVDDLGIRATVSITDLPPGEDDQILIVRERAGFALRSLAAIGPLAARYREHVRFPKAMPVHIAKDPGAFETIPGIFPPDQEAKRRAMKAFVVGIQWGIFDLENTIVVHRQRLPGMSFLDTTIIGTLDRPLRAVKYLIDHPELVDHATAEAARIVAEMQVDPATRADRLASLERYYLRILEDCRRIGSSASSSSDPDGGLDKLPLWDLAEAILAFNAENGFSESAPPQPASKRRPADRDLPPLPAQPSLQGSVEGVTCHDCGCSWPSSAKFCAECATPLARVRQCGACGSAAPPSGKFCPECAEPLESLRPARPLARGV